MEWCKFSQAKNLKRVLFVLCFGIMLQACGPQNDGFDVPDGEEEYLQVYFNKTQNGEDRPGYFKDIVIAYIGSAKLSLDIAMFTSEENEVARALNRALNRGVRIRYVTSGDKKTKNSAFKVMKKKIPVLYGDPGFSMHHKFFIIDEKVVINSSANSARWDHEIQANNMLVIQDKEFASAFLEEFEEMWGGKEDLPNPNQARFGWEKEDQGNHHFLVDDVPIEIYFNPVDSCNKRLIEVFEDIDHELTFAQMMFFGGNLGDALSETIQREVSVKGVLREYYANFNLCEYWNLKPIGADIRIDTVKQGIHHKFATIDAGHMYSDPIVITGSYNWHADSLALDDNMIIIHSDSIAQLYRDNFQMEYDRAIEHPTWEKKYAEMTAYLKKKGKNPPTAIQTD